MTDARPAATSLDLPPDEMEQLLARVGVLAAREVEAARNGPIFAVTPSVEALSQSFDHARDLPLEGESLDELLYVCDRILTAGQRTAPAFFGYVHSPPSPIGIAADLLASATDQNVTAWRSAPAATDVERIAIQWLGQLVGFADDSAGILVGGGSAANLTALFLALRARAPVDGDRRSLSVYAAEGVHFSVAKAADVIGVKLRQVGVDAASRLDTDALRRTIETDRRAGLVPFCVVGTAGTVATGAVDPLDAIAPVAADESLWFHIDGAYGAPAAADPASRPLFSGIEQADSLAVDAHKWLYTPIDCGALLFRDAGAGANAFGSGAGDYVRVLAEEEAESYAFWEHGLELSRRFRALKLWMTLRYYGARRIAAAIAEDIAMAEHLARLVEASEDLELLAGPGLSICCFRHVPPGVPENGLDRHNERVLDAVQRDGRVYLSNASLDGTFALRACITNFRTTRSDVERMLAVVRELGAGLADGVDGAAMNP